MTAADASDLLLEAALVLYAASTLAFVAEILLAGRPQRQGVPVRTAGGSTALADRGPGRSDVDDAAPTREDAWPAPAERFGRAGLTSMTVAFGFHLGAVVFRGLAAGRAPWGNMYEFMVVASLVAVGVFLALGRRYDVRFLGVWVGTLVLITLGLAVTVVYTEAAPLLPALRSTWLVIHVLAAIIATGLFTIGAILSALYLVSGQGGSTGFGRYLDRLPDRPTLDRLAFRVHAVAFPVYTFAVLIAGPIWAQYAWGRYWGWDPKEVWAFITWVIYAAYLHARLTAGWKGRAAAMVALAGFGTLLFNFVGVNLLFSGMHSYAGL